MRFADPFKISDNLSADEKLEAERLMFLELTQGLSFSAHGLVPSYPKHRSLSLGKLD